MKRLVRRLLVLLLARFARRQAVRLIRRWLAKRVRRQSGRLVRRLLHRGAGMSVVGLARTVGKSPLRRTAAGERLILQLFALAEALDGRARPHGSG